MEGLPAPGGSGARQAAAKQEHQTAEKRPSPVPVQELTSRYRKNIYPPDSMIVQTREGFKKGERALKRSGK
jgi:hypothetical protein